MYLHINLGPSYQRRMLNINILNDMLTVNINVLYNNINILKTSMYFVHR